MAWTTIAMASLTILSRCKVNGAWLEPVNAWLRDSLHVRPTGMDLPTAVSTRVGLAARTMQGGLMAVGSVGDILGDILAVEGRKRRQRTVDRGKSAGRSPRTKCRRIKRLSPIQQRDPSMQRSLQHIDLIYMYFVIGKYNG